MTSVSLRRSTRLSSKIHPNTSEEVESAKPRRRQPKTEAEDFSFIKPTKQTQCDNVIENEETEDVRCPTMLLAKTPTKREKSKTRNVDKGFVTPPKQRKTENNENNSPTTPSVLMQKLSLISSPQCDKSNNRKKLFKSEGDVYLKARRALHSSCPSDMPGRTKELQELDDFIMGHLENKSSGSLYVSGPPGTGKTASINLIIHSNKIAPKVIHLYINCTAIKSSSAIFTRIVEELNIKSSSKTEKDSIKAIESYLEKSTRKTILLVLDEIDQLESKNQAVLYKIFEWPSIPNSRLILIGIANALDLTDRILPRLQFRCELKPKLMHFAPYTKTQIVEILSKRLKDAEALDIFKPVALQMLAGKVAAVSGDLRRALDIARRVVEMVDNNNKNDTSEAVLKCVDNIVEADLMKRVELKEVISVLDDVYNPNLDKEDESFPLQQKIAICCLILILKKAKNKDVTIGRLHEVYRRACLKRNIQVMDQGEFVSVCSLIETRGIIKIIKKKDPRMSKIGLVWDEAEIDQTLKDKQLLAAILDDDQCLGKM